MNSNSGNAIELPRYQCHKQVYALKIKSIERLPEESRTNSDRESDGCGSGAIVTPEEDRRYAPFTVSADYLRRHKPVAGGYYVVYDDGYQSFSPAKAFEEGYTLI